MPKDGETYHATQKGFSLFEVIIAVLLLAIISSMMYSILNVSLRFAEKGEKHILLLARKQGLIGLLQRQIKNSWYDEQKKKVDIIADDTTLRITTREPLLYPEAGIVVAFYRYDLGSEKLYYLEKRDFYNIDYNENYIPELDEMQILVEQCPPLSFAYGANESSVTVYYRDKEYTFSPWCQIETRMNSI